MGVTTQPKPQAMGKWTHGLCGCCSDCRICACTYFCPCVIQGEIAERTGKCSSACVYGGLGLVFCPLIFMILTCQQRKHVREQHDIPGSDCGDFCLSYFCGLCVIAQSRLQYEDVE